MKPLGRKTIANALDLRHSSGLEGPPITAIFTDSRHPVVGGLFVALVGPNHNGHEHLQSALDAGALALVVSDRDALPNPLPSGVLVCRVDDTRQALARLGTLVRAAHMGKFVAITGSVGKTTVKDMTAAALKNSGSVAKSPGNWNNDIGVPLSLFATSGDERFAVMELGMSAPGEIDALSRIVLPSVGLVTSASAAHLEFFRSIDEIADAKAELWKALPPGARAITCADDARMLARARWFRPRGLLTYGLADSADVRVREVQQDETGITAVIETSDEKVSIRLSVLGRHNAVNAAAAIAVAQALNISASQAADSLQTHFEPSPHRMTVHATKSGGFVIDDCYNANPISTRAALETLASLAKDAPARGAVLGSMLELGIDSEELHQAIGMAAAEANLDWLGAVGPFADALADGARGAGLGKVSTVTDAEDLVSDVEAFDGPGHWLLLKGSRGMRLERLLPFLGVEGAV